MCIRDRPLADPKGNPTPKGDADQLMDEASTMFRELSSDTDAFFTFMRQSEAMDLLAKPGKESGGYCTCLLYTSWISRVPFRKREPEQPDPYFSTASIAAAFTRGSLVNPR